MGDKGVSVLILILGLFGELFHLGTRLGLIVGVIFCTLRFIGLILWGWIYILLPFIIAFGAWLIEWGLNITIDAIDDGDEEE